MKGLNWIVLATCLLMSGMTNAAALELTPTLLLNEIKVLKPSEQGGDELYFDISIYRPGHSIEYLRVPKSPIHWSSKIMNEFKNVPLWSNTIQPGEMITLIISLVDSDDSYMNPDDLIGSIRVDVKNEQGKLRLKWSVPNRLNSLAIDADGHAQKFDLKGKENQFHVYLSLSVSPETNLPPHKS